MKFCADGQAGFDGMAMYTIISERYVPVVDKMVGDIGAVVINIYGCSNCRILVCGLCHSFP